MIVVNLDVMMARRKMTLSQLAERVDITLANLSVLKNNKAKAVRFTTLEAICAALDCRVTPARLLRLNKAICRILTVDYDIAHFLYCIGLSGKISVVSEGSHESIETGSIVALLDLNRCGIVKSVRGTVGQIQTDYKPTVDKVALAE